MIQKIISRRFAVVSGLVIMNALGFANVARAQSAQRPQPPQPPQQGGVGAIAGGVAFTMDANGNVTGVAVSAAVGKENASAAAFNYENQRGGLQNSAWAFGSAGIQEFKNVGDADGFNVTTTEDSDRSAVQRNSFNPFSLAAPLGTATEALVGPGDPPFRDVAR